MDFLESFDLNVSKKKSRRVRSWYLYEQFKSLEANQVVAAQKLKNRADQETILRQELLERRARRNLYDQYEVKENESRATRSVKSSKASLCASDDFFESFSEHQENFYRNAECESECSQVHCQTNYDDYKTIEENTIETETVNSVTEIRSDDTITQDSNKNLSIETQDNLKQINFHFDEVREHLDNLAKLTETQSCKNSDTESLYSYEDEMRLVKMEDKNVYTQDNNIFAMWSKLVSFAYQIIELNHGNCYYDYGSQFLTAILACDVLRRGVNKMCDILQPYVSPIKFATNPTSQCSCFKNVRRKLSETKIRKKSFIQKLKAKKKMKPTKKSQFARKYRSESWQPCPKQICQPTNQRQDPKSEPWRSVEKISIDLDNASPKSSKTSKPSTIWPGFSSTSCSKSSKLKPNFECDCRNSKVINPMVKLSQYIDSVLKEVNDCNLK